jgi:aquaporin TIP
VEPDAARRAVAELVGAFTLIFAGAGAILTGADLVGVALAHGLAIAVMVSAVGHISGGHFNPAVTFGFLVARRIDPGLALVYWLAQLTGATLAALTLWWIYPDAIVDARKLAAPALNEQIGAGAGFAVEAVLTFFLVWVVFATAADARGTFKSIAGLAIGLTITLGVLMGGPLTGAALNPARAFGPELIGNAWGDAWIWYLGPLLGGGAAALLYEMLYLRPLRPLPVGPPETGLEEPRPGDAAVS